jgi:hypothetical protein
MTDGKEGKGGKDRKVGTTGNQWSASILRALLCLSVLPVLPVLPDLPVYLTESLPSFRSRSTRHVASPLNHEYGSSFTPSSLRCTAAVLASA